MDSIELLRSQHLHSRRGPDPLRRLLDFARSERSPGPDRIEEIARETGLPPASIRGALSYYAELRESPADWRVCTGTSCVLRGQDLSAIEAGSGCRAVYCLGHCDRSPAALRADGALRLGSNDAPAGPRPAAPAVRSLVADPIVTRRLGDAASGLGAARRAGAYRALESALRRRPSEVIAALEASGERGRGGAGFSTGAKWRACAESPGDSRYVVANGDEGDPGSFLDRVLMEGDPHGVLEGLLLCAFAVGAREAIVFVRAEYPAARAAMEAAVQEARDAGILGASVLGSGVACEVSVFPGMGSYVCGEETALLNAIEGFRGEVRLRPPYPTQSGLYGRPTVVQNVETLVNVPAILERGASAYRALGTRASPGTKALCLNAGFARPGIVEVEFGTPLRAVIEEAGGSDTGRPLAAILLGGPMGSVVTPEQWDVALCYEAMAERGISLGHGGLVAVPDDVDWRALLLHWLRFMRDESCGRCAPCSLGSARALELAAADSRTELAALLDVIEQTSLCAFGQLLPRPLRQLLERIAQGKDA